MMGITQLQQRISELERELANKSADISKLQQSLASKESRISSLEQQLSNLQNQLANKDAQISNLQSEINRLINTTRIVQSEAYLMRMNGTFNQNVKVDSRSTYFTTLGRQIKIVARLWANQKIIAEFGSCYIYVCYVYGGKYVGVTTAYFKFDEKSWDFTHELVDVLYLKLDAIPKEIFGKVPLYIVLYLSLRYPRFYDNPSLLIFYEVTAYDVYPP
jgi:uncharacterized coiled-coil protein SlyX